MDVNYDEDQIDKGDSGAFILVDCCLFEDSFGVYTHSTKNSPRKHLQKRVSICSILVHLPPFFSSLFRRGLVYRKKCMEIFKEKLEKQRFRSRV